MCEGDDVPFIGCFDLVEHARPEQMSLFLMESSAMYGLSHVNIHSILGVCRDDEGDAAPMAIYPRAEEGNMKKFLQNCRMPECGSRNVSCVGHFCHVNCRHFVQVFVLL